MDRAEKVLRSYAKAACLIAERTGLFRDMPCSEFIQMLADDDIRIHHRRDDRLQLFIWDGERWLPDPHLFDVTGEIGHAWQAI